MVVRCRGSYISYTIGSQMAVRLSDLSAAEFYYQNYLLVIISVRV
jgi:hypothetical protein